MRPLCGIVLAAVVAGLAPASAAQETSALQALRKNLEMPAHRSLMSVIEAPDTQLTPFETDGCSGGMSWSWRVVADLFPDFAEAQGEVPPWEACCVIHDRAYHDAGGPGDAEQSFDARLVADEALKECVADPDEAEIERLAVRYDTSEDQVRFAYDLIASSMFNAVRFGGGPCSGLPWRWGFGYPGCVPGF